MNKIYMTKRGHDGKTVVCSEKTRARGKVKSLVLAMTAASAMLAAVDAVAATATAPTAGTVITDGGTDGSLAITSSGTATANGAGSLALGSGSLTTGRESIAIGSSSTATGIGSTAIGTRAKTLLGVVDNNLPLTTAIGYNSSVSGYKGLAVGANTNVTGSHSIGIGTSLGVFGNNSVRIGSDHRTGQNTLGGGSFSANPIVEDNIVEIGVNTRSAANSVVIGYNAIVQKDADITSAGLNIRGVALGADSWVGKGHGKTVNGVALGASASVTHNNSVALGAASASAPSSNISNATLGGIQYGEFAGNVSNGTISVGASFSRQVKNVAAGAIIATSTDAINGSQLYAVATNFGNLANSVKTELGGNAALAPNGTITMTNIGGTGQNTIHDAIAFVNAKQGGATTNVVQGDGVTVTNATVNGEKTFTVGLSDATKANIAKAQTDAAKGIADAAAAQANATKAIADAKAADNKAVAAQNTANTANTTAQAANTTANRVAATTYTFSVANGQTAATTTTGTADTWRTTAADSLTLGATTDLSVSTDGAGKVIYGLSDATKANIAKAQTDAAKGIADAAAAQANATKAIADAKAADNKAVAAQNTANTAVTKADAAQATADKATADIKALDDIAVKYDSTAKDTVTLGGADGTTITNVKDGAITADSKDAVNGGQLYALTEKVNNLDATDVVAGKGTTVTKSTQGNLNTYTVSVSDETLANIAKAQTDAAKGIADAAAAQANATKAIADAKAADNKAVAAQNTANTAVTKADAAQATADKATADIKALDDIAVKYDSTAKDTVTLGGADGTTITNVKDGAITADSKDAVNGGQLFALSEKVNNIKLPEVVQGDGITVINTTVGGTKTFTVALSDETKTSITTAQSTADKAVADAKAADDKAKAAQATADKGVADAAKAQQTADKAAADIKALDDITVKYDDAAKGTVTLAGVDGTTITNVKDGAIAAGSKDAVNGSQLYAVKGVADVAKAQSDANKTAITALDTKKADKSALAATDAKVKANADNIAKGFNVATADGTSTNYQLGDTVSILGGKNIDTTTVDGDISVALKDDITVKTIAIEGSTVGMSADGVNAGGKTITNVAPGVISPSSTDAINGSQLYQTNMNVAQNTQSIGVLKERMDEFDDALDAQAAGARAALGIPQVTLPGKSMVGVGLGNYGDAQALAVGFSRLSDNARTILKGSIDANTKDTNKFGVSLGLGFQW